MNFLSASQAAKMTNAKSDQAWELDAKCWSNLIRTKMVRGELCYHEQDVRVFRFLRACGRLPVPNFFTT